MKSKLLTLFMFALISTTVNAAKYIPVKLIDTNGKKQKGYARPIGSGPYKYIFFKPTMDAKRQKIPCDNLKTAIYFYSDGNVEYDRMNIYDGGWDKKPSKKKIWLKVLKRDYLTLYFARNLDRMPKSYSRIRGESLGRYWLFHREGEDGATFISLGGGLNGNSVFKMNAKKYFKDYPELAAKIKNKEYKWKDIDEVVKLYNRWYDRK